ncbi:acyl-CoA N-acyltransferase [Blastocladiella britannica]|nr:acyl-CoA N-acyltransferase [Blastocladiella britannica]
MSIEIVLSKSPARWGDLPAPTLRPVEPADVPALWQMNYELHEYEKITHEVSGTPEMLLAALFPSEDDKLAGRAMGSAHAVVLERELAPGEVVPGNLKHVVSAVHPTRLYLGFCVYFFSFATAFAQYKGHVEDLYVREPYRSFGYGSVLLQSVIRHLVVHANVKCVEWICLDWNCEAIKFYTTKCHACVQDGWSIYRVSGQDLENYRDWGVRQT